MLCFRDIHRSRRALFLRGAFLRGLRMPTTTRATPLVFICDSLQQVGSDGPIAHDERRAACAALWSSSLRASVARSLTTSAPCTTAVSAFP